MKDYFGYAGKVCVVTGAASGMGQSCTEILVDMGAEVYALDRNSLTVPGTKKDIIVDLLHKDSIDAAFAQIPDRIDCFFGIAGITGIHNTAAEVFMVNYGANKYITEEYLAKRVPDDTGAILYITSSAGEGWQQPEAQEEFMRVIKDEDGNLLSGWDAVWNACVALDEYYRHPGATNGPYGASKRAMNYYFALIAPVFGERRIRVNAVLPMGTTTALTPEFAAMSGGVPQEIRVKYNGWARRWADPREQAEPAVFLNSNMASFLSGVIIAGDYGYHLKFDAGFEKRNVRLGITEYKRKVEWEAAQEK